MSFDFVFTSIFEPFRTFCEQSYVVLYIQGRRKVWKSGGLVKFVQTKSIIL